MDVAGRLNHVLVVVLDGVQGFDDVVVIVVEDERRDDVTLDVLEGGVAFDVLLHRLADGARPRLDALVLPRLVERREQVVGHVQTRSHTRRVAPGPQRRCATGRSYYATPVPVITAPFSQYAHRQGMFESLPTGVVVGAVGLGLLHGAEPGHGWPVAATYALEKPNKWLAGFAASTVLGVGHLVSSLAVVGAFFLLKAGAGVESALWLDYLAGTLLILLGVHEYRSGHSHGHSHGHDGDEHGDGHSYSHGHGDGHSHGLSHSHEHGDEHFHEYTDEHSHEHGDDHSHEHSHADNDHAHAHDQADDGNEGVLARVRGVLPFGDSGHGHSHDHESLDEAAERGLWSIAGTAFVLGFAHEEEFEIIGLCAGSSLCLELMTAYALAVVAGIVALTLLLVAGYERYESRVQRWSGHFPTVSAVVLVAMGLGFIAGVL